MRLPHERLLAAFDELLACELANRLHHPHAGFPVGLLAQLQQALVHQRVDAVEDVDAEILLRVGDRLGRLERAAADKDRQSAEEALFGLTEQVVAPRNRAAQRLLSSGQIPGAAGEDLQPAFHPAEHRRRRQCLHTCRRQLDGQRQPVEAVADLGDEARVLACELEVRLRGRRAFDKQGDGGIPRQRVERGRRRRIRPRQRQHWHLVLLVEVQRLTARDEHRERRRNGQQLDDERALRRGGARSCRAGAVSDAWRARAGR